MSEIDDQTIRLAALEGWASNPRVPMPERLNAAMQVIAGLRAELDAATARVVEQTSCASTVVTWMPGAGTRFDRPGPETCDV